MVYIGTVQSPEQYPLSIPRHVDPESTAYSAALRNAHVRLNSQAFAFSSRPAGMTKSNFRGCNRALSIAQGVSRYCGLAIWTVEELKKAQDIFRSRDDLAITSNRLPTIFDPIVKDLQRMSD